MNRASDDIEIAITELLPSVIAFLGDLVDVNSFTGNPQGVGDNADRIVQQFAPFGWKLRRQACLLPGTGEHLILDSGGDGPVIFLISHLDTVYTPDEQAEAYAGWEPGGHVVSGPGVYDIKGGTALLWLVLQALSKLDQKLFRSARWIAAWNAAEERLSPDFAAFCLALSPEPALAALVFEGDNGQSQHCEILEAHHGVARFRLSASGRGAHSGNGHEAGINAIEGLALAITTVSSLTDYSRNTTVNVGVVRGGEATNRVPDFAEAFMEVRFTDPAKLAEIQDRLDNLTPPTVDPERRCLIKAETLTIIPPLVPTDHSRKLAKIWQEAGRRRELDISVGSRRGASDANYFAAHAPVLDGLGPSGGNAHGIERTDGSLLIKEFLCLDSFVPKASLNVAALLELVRRATGEG